jgi:hypothetical protein
MKKSNKLLLGTFLFVFLIFLGIHLALYANLKMGNYSAYREDEDQNRITYNLTPVRYVSINGVREVVVYASDTSRLQFLHKEDEGAFAFRQQNDTLFLSQRDTTSNDNDWNARLLLGVADGAFIKAVESSVLLRGRMHHSGHTTFSVDVIAGNLGTDTEKAAPFETLLVQASGNAQVRLGGARIGKLDATLTNAYLEDEGARIDSIRLQADETSKVLFTGSNFSKAKTTASNE